MLWGGGGGGADTSVVESSGLALVSFSVWGYHLDATHQYRRAGWSECMSPLLVILCFETIHKKPVLH